MVDADTIVHPDCPNFFEMTEHKLCGAQFDGSWDWVLRGIENYSKYMFDGYMMPWYEYLIVVLLLLMINTDNYFKT